MPHHDDAVSLRQMLDHTREASDLVKQRVRADLDQDRVLSLALVLCQIIGEAAAAYRISDASSTLKCPGPRLLLCATG